MSETTTVGPAKGALSRLGNKAYGVAFIAVVALLVGLSIASFQKRFTPVVTVTTLNRAINAAR